MAAIEKIKERIRELAERRENVALAEIRWVVSRLDELGCRTSERVATHGRLFGVGSTRFHGELSQSRKQTSEGVLSRGLRKRDDRIGVV